MICGKSWNAVRDETGENADGHTTTSAKTEAETASALKRPCPNTGCDRWKPAWLMRLVTCRSETEVGAKGKTEG